MTAKETSALRLVLNGRARHTAYPRELEAILSLRSHRAARSVIEEFPGYRATPLHDLQQSAAQFGLARLWVKDECTRFGLGAFKSVGGAYAVYRCLEQRIRELHPYEDVTPDTLRSGLYSDITQDLTIACASAGNHGRAVAWGAQLFGARCVVYLYRDVGPGRRAAIEALGARTDTSAPDYDEAVRRVADDAERNHWQIVSDTAYPGYTDVPRDVMQGYTVIAQEVLEQLRDERPTHVLLQAGVGGFAAALAAHLWETLGRQRPRFIIVEPEEAACVWASIAQQKAVVLPAASSIMGGLACARVSLLAWDVLQLVADACVAIPDELTVVAMKRLAAPLSGEPRIIAGESGASTFAALAALAQNEELCAQIGLGADSRVLLFVTEGATDPAAWSRYTGLTVQATA